MNKKHYVVGGDIKKSLSDGCRFDFKALFLNAFILTRTHYLSLIVACIFTAMIVLATYAIGSEHLLSLSSNMQMGVNFIFSSLIMTPLVTGLSMMGIYHSVGLKTKPIDVFNCFNVTIKLAIVNMIINVLVYGCMTLFSLVSADLGGSISLFLVIYTNVVFCLTYPMVAEKKMSSYLALKLSFQIVHKNIRQFSILFLFIILLAFIAILPYGLGMLIFIPFYFNLMGIVYRQTCGVSLTGIESKDLEGKLLTKNVDQSANEEAGTTTETKNSKSTASDKFDA